MADSPDHKSMRAMANERRRALMELLRGGEMTVNELAAHFDVARPAISRHLRVLREAGLVRYRSERNVRYYSLGQPEIERLRVSLNDSFQDYWMPQGLDDHARAVSGIAQARRTFHEVHVSTELRIPPETAYAFCTDEALFRIWVGEDAENSGRVGGTFSAVSQFGGRLVGEYLALSPTRFIAIRVLSPLVRDDNLYTIEFTATAKGAQVDLRHYVADAGVAMLVQTAWTDTLALLRAAAAEYSG